MKIRGGGVLVWGMLSVAGFADTLPTVPVTLSPREATLVHLTDQSSKIRYAALSRMHEYFSAADALPHIVKRLLDPHRDTRQLAIRILGHIGPLGLPPLQVLIQMTLSKDDYVEAVRMIGRHRDPSSIPALAGLLQHTAVIVRSETLAVMGQIRSEEAAPYFLRALEDPAEKVRGTALLQLLAEKNPAHLPIVMTKLQDPSSKVRRTAIMTVGATGQVKSLPALMEFLGDADPDIRRALEWGLRYMPQEEVRRALAERLSHERRDVRRTAAIWLGRMERPSPEMLEVITEALLKDPNPAARLEAAQTLGEWLEMDAVTALVAAQADQDPKVKAAVKKALDDLGVLEGDFFLPRPWKP